MKLYPPTRPVDLRIALHTRRGPLFTAPLFPLAPVEEAGNVQDAPGAAISSEAGSSPCPVGLDAFAAGLGSVEGRRAARRLAALAGFVIPEVEWM